MYATFDTEGFENWVKEQPAEETYNYDHFTDCAIARFLKSKGYANVSVDADTARATLNGKPVLFNVVSLWDVIRTGGIRGDEHGFRVIERTFGELAEYMQKQKQKAAA